MDFQSVGAALSGVSPVYLFVAVFLCLTALRFLRATVRTMILSVVICGLVYLGILIAKTAGYM